MRERGWQKVATALFVTASVCKKKRMTEGKRKGTFPDATMNSHVKFMARGKSDTAVEGQEVRKDERGAGCNGIETKRNGRGIMWVDEAEAEVKWAKEARGGTESAQETGRVVCL